MEREEYFKIVDILLTKEEVTFTYNNHFIYMQERVDGGYEADIYNSEEDHENELIDPIDGGIFETIVACVAVELAFEISRDLTERGL